MAIVPRRPDSLRLLIGMAEMLILGVPAIFVKCLRDDPYEGAGLMTDGDMETLSSMLLGLVRFAGTVCLRMSLAVPARPRGWALGEVRCLWRGTSADS